MASEQANILLIYTGGTIGMIKDFETGALRNFNFDELLQYIPELQLLDCNIDTTTFKSPIDSSNMNPLYWADLVSIIETNYDADNLEIIHFIKIARIIKPMVIWIVKEIYFIV